MINSKTIIAGILILGTFFFTACSQLSLEEKKSKRHAMDEIAKTTIETLIEDDPDIKTALENAKGYMVVNWNVTKVPIVGGGGGNGVVVDNRNDERIYINVKRFDIGGGVGARSYKNLVVFNDEKLLNEMKKGSFTFQAGAEVAAGSGTAEGGSGVNDDRLKLYVLPEGGAAATATVRFIKSKLASELN